MPEESTGAGNPGPDDKTPPPKAAFDERNPLPAGSGTDADTKTVPPKPGFPHKNPPPEEP